MGQLTASIAHELRQPLGAVLNDGKASLNWLTRDPPEVEEAKLCLEEAIKDVNRSDIQINGGYFVLRKDIFGYMKDGEELLHEPFQRLVERGQLLAYKYDGFWVAMDTFKDKQMLDDIYASGHAPWQVWNHAPQVMPTTRINEARTRMVAGHAVVRR